MEELSTTRQALCSPPKRNFLKICDQVVSAFLPRLNHSSFCFRCDLGQVNEEGPLPITYG
jgi:hypothetical protein